MTLRVLNVAQTARDTALQVQLEWADPDWEFRGNLSMDRMPELRDNLGHVYWESPRSNSSVVVVAIPAPDAKQAPPTPAGPNHTDTLVFPELSLSARQAKLGGSDSSSPRRKERFSSIWAITPRLVMPGRLILIWKWPVTRCI